MASMFDAGSVMNAEIKGLAAAQRELHRKAQAARGDKGLASSMIVALAQLHRYATGIVHVVSGRLKNSLFFSLTRTTAADAAGIVGTNVSYAAKEHDRGGSHAFFARTVREEGKRVNSMFGTHLERRLS